MKISEIFESIQGEGKYAGMPALFIRLSGCNRSCDFCDTKYHAKGSHISWKRIGQIIKRSQKNMIIWTGGEPLLQYEEILKIINYAPNDKFHCLETNGDLLTYDMFEDFHYVCISPKEEKTAKKIRELTREYAKWQKIDYGRDGNEDFDIKVVTDLRRINKNLITFATMLMPLTVDYGGVVDNDNQRRIWKYCVKKNLKYSPRLHVEIFGLKRRV